jgi:hypothetical protein
MGSYDLGPSIFVGAIVVVTVALVIGMAVGNASPMVLNACAQVLQALARGLLWTLSQRTDPNQKGPRAS